MYEEVAVGVKNGRGDPYDMRGAAAPKYGGRKDAAGSASRTRERLNFRVVPSYPHARAASAPTGGSIFWVVSLSVKVNEPSKRSQLCGVPLVSCARS